MRFASLAADIWRNRRGLVNLPRFLTYIVTFRCNARCIMCDSWKKESPDDLTLPEIDGILTQLPPMDVVRLTGGEPFVRPDLPDIAQRVHERLRPTVFHITTNGFLTRRIADFCESRDRRFPLNLLISMDGVGEKHNTVRGRNTAWATALATLQAIAPRREDLNVRVAVNQTIVDADGLVEYRRLRDFLRPLGIRVNVVIAYDVSATYSTDLEVDAAPVHPGEFATFGDLNRRESEELLQELERDLIQFPITERVAKRYYYRGIRNRLLTGTASPNPPCVALNSHLRLYPNGDVPTCQFNSGRVGNLRRQSFKEIWFGNSAAAQRQWVRQCPGCWAECEVLPNAIYTGDLLKETAFPAPILDPITAPPSVVSEGSAA